MVTTSSTVTCYPYLCSARRDLRGISASPAKDDIPKLLNERTILYQREKHVHYLYNESGYPRVITLKRASGRPNTTCNNFVWKSMEVQTSKKGIRIISGNPNDKVLFARCRSVPGRLERRHSLRLWGSARRLHRSGSSRSLPRRPDRSDTSSSAEYASTDSAPHSPTSESPQREGFGMVTGAETLAEKFPPRSTASDYFFIFSHIYFESALPFFKVPNVASAVH